MALDLRDREIRRLRRELAKVKAKPAKECRAPDPLASHLAGLRSRGEDRRVGPLWMLARVACHRCGRGYGVLCRQGRRARFYVCITPGCTGAWDPDAYVAAKAEIVAYALDGEVHPDAVFVRRCGTEFRALAPAAEIARICGNGASATSHAYPQNVSYGSSQPRGARNEGAVAPTSSEGRKTQRRASIDDENEGAASLRRGSHSERAIAAAQEQYLNGGRNPWADIDFTPEKPARRLPCSLLDPGFGDDW